MEKETTAIINSAAEYLQGFDIPNPRRESEILLGHLVGCERPDLYVDFERKLEAKVLNDFRSLLAKRVRREPLQYLIGEAQFMGLDFIVAPDVFIPRPETEILVEAILEKFTGELIIFDLGTGCGNIAIAIARSLPHSKVFASDISGQALRVAKQNVERHGMQGRVHLFGGDLFESLGHEKIDLIVSNPPYVASSQVCGLGPEVKYEPAIALDGGPDGLDYLKRIVEESPRYLKRGGLLALEVGFDQAHRMSEIIQGAKRFVDVEIIKDYNQIDRVIVAKLLVRRLWAGL